MNTNDRSTRPPVGLLLVVGLVVAYGVVLALSSKAGFPASPGGVGVVPYLGDRPIGEDGYYMLTVAKNIATGQGVTYTYGKSTTGVQPLCTFLFAGLYYVNAALGGDEWTFLRLVILMGVASLCVAAHLVGLLTSRLWRTVTGEDRGVWPYALAAGTVVCSFSLFRLFTYGLETGVYVALVAACVLVSLELGSREGGWTLSRAALFGLVCGIAALTRIDFLVLVTLFVASQLALRRMALGPALTTLSVAGLAVLPWFLFVYSVTGRFVPSSGTAQGNVISADSVLLRARRMLQAVVNAATPWIYSAPEGYLLVAALAVVVALAALVAVRPRARSALWAFALQPVVAGWAVAFVALLCTYFVFFWASHFYLRYSLPLVVISVPAVAIALLACDVDRWRATRVALYGLLGLFFVWAALTMHTGRLSNPHLVTAGYLRQNYSASKVGSFQSGTLGFFNANVVNLDGKVNHEALLHQKNGQMGQYLDAEGIEVIVDWESYITANIRPEDLAGGWRRCDESVPSGVDSCYRRRVESVAP